MVLIGHGQPVSQPWILRAGCVAVTLGTSQRHPAVSAIPIFQTLGYWDRVDELRVEWGRGADVQPSDAAGSPFALTDTVRQQNYHPLGRHEAHLSQRLCGPSAGQDVRGWDPQFQW